jgi:hypothetical protein
MHSSQRLLLSLALAFSTLLCPVLASAQNVDSQRPKQSSAIQRARSSAVKCLVAFERVPLAGVYCECSPEALRILTK